MDNVYVLKLNVSNTPIEIIKLRDALRLWAKNKVSVVATYTDKVLKGYYDYDYNDWSYMMNAPAVVRLKEAFKIKKGFKVYKSFTRRNIWERDKGKCQYCGRKISLRELTFDHVYPKSLGGKNNWKNIVSSCQDCNNKKGNRLLHECGMKLLNKPYAPIIADSYYESVMQRMKKIKWLINIKEWQSWIYWNVNLEEET